ncbi:hypothetical protein ACTXT7_002281 [Hymenolepis weldensis]
MGNHAAIDTESKRHKERRQGGVDLAASLRFFPMVEKANYLLRCSAELTESFNGTKAYFKRRGRNEEEVRKLMARWEDVMNKNGDYVEH